MEIAAFQDVLRRTYVERDAERGIDGTFRWLTEEVGEVARAVRPDAPVAVLSGPTFAHEVAAGKPTAVTLACADSGVRAALGARLASPSFRPYASEDVVGAEIGGAVKNVLAVACGVVEGAGLGQNARAALIARGYAEMMRFGEALGAERNTLAGLCGLGDLVLTCSSPQSRNMSVGLALGSGQSLQDALAGKLSVAEGVASAPAVLALARSLGVETPICAAVAGILAGQISVDRAIEALLSRPLTSE